MLEFGARALLTTLEPLFSGLLLATVEAPGGILDIESKGVERERIIVLDLTETEVAALDALCQKKELSRTAVLRQALRVYQLVERRLSEGGTLILEDQFPKNSPGWIGH